MKEGSCERGELRVNPFLSPAQLTVSLLVCEAAFFAHLLHAFCFSGHLCFDKIISKHNSATVPNP